MVTSQLLANWEYEGERPHVATAEQFVYKGELVRVELLRSNNQWRLVFRRGEDDGSWTVDYTIRDVETALNASRYWREFYVEGDNVKIFFNGKGQWPSAHASPEYTTFCVGHSVAKTTSSQTYKWLVSRLAHFGSDVSFARRFSQSTPTQKWQTVFGLEDEEQLSRSRAAMNHLCHLVLCSDVGLWQQESKLYWGLHASHGPHAARFWLRSLTSSKKLSSPYLKEWATLVERFGPTSVRLDRVCIREFVEANPLLASGQLCSPSAHEQLETRLALRAWARQNVPDGVHCGLDT